MSRVIDYAIARRLGRVGVHNPGRRYGSDHDLVEFEVDGARVGLWNARRDRDRGLVVDLVDSIMETRDLDALLLTEANDYVAQLRRAQHDAPWRIMANSVRPGADEVAVILRDGVIWRAFQSRRMARRGWRTARRGRMTHPRYLAAVEVRLASGWATLAVTHFPPSARWRRGRMLGPVLRVIATRRQARNLVRWANSPRAEGRLFVAADWNEEPSTRGRYSPRWIADRVDGRIEAPRQGTHGRDRART